MGQLCSYKEEKALIWLEFNQPASPLLPCCHVAMLPHCDAFKCLPPSVVFYFLILQENRLEKNSTITHDETFLWLWKPDINKLELFAY